MSPLDCGCGVGPDLDPFLWMTSDFFSEFPGILEQEPPRRAGRGKGGQRRRRNRHRFIPLDLIEADDHYEILADIPGADKNQIQVQTNGDLLTIGVEPEKEPEQPQEAQAQEGAAKAQEGKEAPKEQPAQGEAKLVYHRHERRHDWVHRSIRMPEDADLDHVKAKYENGVLKLTIPKNAEAQKSRQVPVQ
ncbi:hypothetical protein WJX72_006071 [[Myrmecia] bisecta]|uniref:SHSP domain-containing protein n=1 Tax=[Myrmecia] bisecta TaxID=41462 RepID=A0AAW1P6V9_9CHLO